MGSTAAPAPPAGRVPGHQAAPPICRVADAVRRHRYIGACYGAPGLGKTLSARTYAAADDYDEWERDRYSRGNVLPASLVASRTLFYTPLVHVTGRRLNLEVDMFAGSLSADINRALNPDCQPDIDEFIDIPYLTELVIIDEAAIDSTPLPADWATVEAFNVGCPGAPATIRRRLAAIAHHHRAAGHPPPTDPARELPHPSREPIDPGQVDMLMRLLRRTGGSAGCSAGGTARC